jgi:glutamine synthetase
MPTSRLADMPKNVQDAIAEARFVEAFVFDVTGAAIGKRLPVADVGKLMTAGFRMTPSNLLYDLRGRGYGVLGIGVGDGDPDCAVIAQPDNFMPLPWLDQPQAQVLCRMAEPETGNGIWFDPRTVLEIAVARLAALGYRAVCACELEFWLIDDSVGFEPAGPDSGLDLDGRCYRLEKLSDYDRFLALLDATFEAQRIPVGAVSAEYGTSQFEVNLAHRDDPVKAAEDALLQKRAVRGVARSMGLGASFMAKPFPEDAGSGLHVHVSLVDAEGRNAFDERREGGDALLMKAIAGLQESAMDCMSIFAPTTNAYRRFVPGMFVPTGPTWAHENRSVALRVPGQGGGARRIEHRLSGADANPFLVLAAILGGIARGIEAGLAPTAPAEGDAAQEFDPTFPRRPWEAIRAFEHSAAAKDIFGRFHAAWTDLKVKELDAFLDETLEQERRWAG